MDEKDRVIKEIYNESKERARFVQEQFFLSCMCHLVGNVQSVFDYMITI